MEDSDCFREADSRLTGLDFADFPAPGRALRGVSFVSVLTGLRLLTDSIEPLCVEEIHTSTS